MPFKIVYEIENIKDYINKLISSQLSFSSFDVNIFFDINASKNANHHHYLMLIAGSMLLALEEDPLLRGAITGGLCCGIRVDEGGFCVGTTFINVISIFVGSISIFLLACWPAARSMSFGIHKWIINGEQTHVRRDFPSIAWRAAQ